MRTMLVAALMWSTAALGQTAQQTEFLHNFAMGLYAEQRCPNLRMNLLLVKHLGETAGLSPDEWGEGGKFRAEFLSRIKEVIGNFQKMDDPTFCGAVEDGFGPEGTFVKGLIKRR